MADDGSLKSQINNQSITDDLATYTRERVAAELAQSTRDIANRLVQSTADIAERLISIETCTAKRLEQQYDLLRQDLFAEQMKWKRAIVGLNLGILAVLIVVVCKIFTLP